MEGTFVLLLTENVLTGIQWRRLMIFTPSQLEAIECLDQNLQIIACAGSGKTQVIAERIVRILATRSVTPAAIVAFTFTEKAATELKDRIHRLCQERLGTTQGLAEMYVGTIHAYCLRLLQSPPVYQFLKYTVLTDVRQRLLVDRYSSKSGLTRMPKLAGGTLARWKDSGLFQGVIGILSEAELDRDLIPNGVWASYDTYCAFIDSRFNLDYSQMMVQAVTEIIQNDVLREQVANQLRYLVVDEYQDVNPLQESLIRIMHDLGANLCVVGDDDQTIYQFRGSDVRNIIDFANRYPNVRQVRLAENHRSSNEIVTAARRTAGAIGNRLDKSMEGTAAQPFELGDILGLTFPSVDDEAAWIAEKIGAMHEVAYRDRPGADERGLAFGDMAILLRSVRGDGRPILNALDAANIPYVVGGVNELFDTLEAQAVRRVFYFLGDHVDQQGTATTLADVRQALETAELGIAPAAMQDGLVYLERIKAAIQINRSDAELFLQRVYLDFLATVGVREETVARQTLAGNAGEIVFFNLGKFSQVISDFEQVHLNRPPIDVYRDFAGFLCFQAPGYYPEGWLDKGAARPDAVQILTVHQAKGMQWPVVFLPCLRRNRFPSRRMGGQSAWHVIPDIAVRNSDRYKGTVEDERRLFYVAMTRAERFLFCSWGPIPNNQQQRNPSEFLRELTTYDRVLTREPLRRLPTAEVRPRNDDQTLTLTFSQLKYYFECPYQFKLRFLYGFDEPINRAVGYGKSVHDALAEIHSESIRGRVPDAAEVPALVERHLHLPFASAQVEEYLRRAANEALSRYLRDNREKLENLEHVEKPIELKLEEGIVVQGRIDLIRRTDTQETVIVDFKSDERAQAESVTHAQLHVYAVGYEQLTGTSADLIEVHNLDKGGAKREKVDAALNDRTLEKIVEAGQNLRANNLPRLPVWGEKCEKCGMRGICRRQPAAGQNGQ